MKDLDNDLSMFVDIMYYDFVLYKLVELYEKPMQEARKVEGEEYFGIAKKLFKKLNDKDINLDNQIALKILFIRFKRLSLSSVCHNHTNPSCCSLHIRNFLSKAFECIEEMKKEHVALLENKTFQDLNVLVASLVLIVYYEEPKDDLLVSACEYLKTHSIEIKDKADFLRLRKSMFIKLGVINDASFGIKLLMAIDNMLDKILKMLKEPFLYTLSVEKVTNILRKHVGLFKNESEILQASKNDIFEPETPGEAVEWSEQ